LKKLLLALGLATLFALSASASDRELIEKIEASTVMLYTQDLHGGMSFHCTGTLFNSKHGLLENTYYVLTAAHCAQTDDEQYFVSLETEESNTFLKAGVVTVGNIAEGNDFAILKVRTHKTLPTLELGDERDEYSGAPILNVNGRAGQGPQVEHGYISELHVDRPLKDEAIDWTGCILVSLTISGGSSGSAIVSATSGKILGVVVGQMATGFFSPPISIVMPISRLASITDTPAWEISKK